MMKKMFLGTAAVAVLTSGVSAATINAGNAVYPIGTLGGPGDPQSSIPYALTVHDGVLYTAGESWSPTWGGAHPFIGVLDTTSQIIEISNPSGDANSRARGVSVAPTAGQIAAGGQVGGIGRYYIAPLNNIAGGSWSTMYGSSSACEGFNVNRTDTATDRTEVVGRNTGNNRGLRVRMTVGAWSSSVAEYVPGYGNYVTTKSISQNRVMVGEEQGTPRSRDAIYNDTLGAPNRRVPLPNPGEQSLGFGISEDGSHMVGLVYNSAEAYVFDAFLWDRNDATATILNSTGWEINPLAYAANDDGMAVGRVWSDPTGEVASIWLSKTAQVQTVEDLAASYVIDTSDWDQLTRAYGISNVGTDGKYAITGYGVWAADGTTRGFVLVVPEPATLSFLALGGLALLRRRR